MDVHKQHAILDVVSDQKHTALVANLLLSIAVAYQARHTTDVTTCVIWATVVCGITILRLFITNHVRKYLKQTESGSSPLSRRTVILFRATRLGVILQGVAWAVGVYLFWNSDPMLQMLISFIIAGLVAGASSAYSMDPKAFIFFSFPPSATLVVLFILQNNQPSFIMSQAVVLFFALMTRITFRTKNYLHEFYEFSKQNSELLENTRKHNSKLVHSNRLMFKDSKQALHASRLQALGEMSAGIAHEINNPLAVIRGSAEILPQLLKAPQKNEEKINTSIKRIVRTVDRISDIIKSLRAFSHSDNDLEKKIVPFGVVLNQALSLSSEKFRQNGVDLRIKIMGKEFEMFCHEIQISQVLLNLLSNAHDAVINRPKKQVLVLASSDSDSVSILVEDTGGGISPENMSLIFEPFFTTKDIGKGTGLGLSMSKGIIEDHGGKIKVSSTPEGSSFEIILPKSVASTNEEKAA